MYFDTHTHVNSNAFGEETPEVIQRALESGVWMTNVGTGLESSRRVADLAMSYPEGVYATIGIHPSHTWQDLEDPDESTNHKRESFSPSEFEKLLNPRVVAVGEIGLDYFRLPEDPALAQEAKKIQQEQFVNQVKFANKHDLPVVIHCRDAYEDTLEVLKAESCSEGIIHSFTGSWEIAKQFLDQGFYVALNGILNFDKTGRLAEVCKNLPAERILSETDAPYLAPPPFRGKRNEPLYVTHIVEHMAKLRGVTPEQMADQTFQNAKVVYKI